MINALQEKLKMGGSGKKMQLQAMVPNSRKSRILEANEDRNLLENEGTMRPQKVSLKKRLSETEVQNKKSSTKPITTLRKYTKSQGTDKDNEKEFENIVGEASVG